MGTATSPPSQSPATPAHTPERPPRTPADLDTVRIDAHISGDMIWIDMFLVPTDRRRQGLGTAAFQRFLTTIPNRIKYIRLEACDTGSGPSNAFWEGLGFDYRYDGDGMPYEAANSMIMGIHGVETPRARPWGDD